LRGAGSMLGKRQVKSVYMEVLLVPTYIGQPRFEDYLQLFRSVGYMMLDMYNPVRSNVRLNQVDAISIYSSD